MKRVIIEWTANNGAEVTERKATIVAKHEDGKGFDVKFDDNGETWPIPTEMILKSYILKTVADFINEFAGKSNWHTNTKGIQSFLTKNVDETDGEIEFGCENLILSVVGSTRAIEVKRTSKNKASQYGSEYLVKFC